MKETTIYKVNVKLRDTNEDTRNINDTSKIAKKKPPKDVQPQ
jgi:hypothetical protein